MKHYLVTGGAGFIGSHLVEALLAAGQRVTVLDNFSTGKKENLQLGAKLVQGDICQSQTVEAAFVGIDGCFHLAAIPSVTQSIDQWALTHRVNLGGTVTIFEQAAKQGVPVVYASSAAVYGDCDRLPLKETESAFPLSPYGLDKASCEEQARVGALCRGLRSIGLRLFNVYGPRQDPKSPYSGVISIFMQKIREKQPLTIFGDGQQSRDFIYVGDVVRHFIVAMQLLQSSAIQQEICNVATEIQTTVNELAKNLMETGGINVTILHAEERKGEIRFSCGSKEKAQHLLKLGSSLSIAEGLNITWKSFL